MIFNTLPFLPFLLAILLTHRIAPWKFNKGFLLLASYIFYASFSPPYLLLLLISTAIDFVAGRRIYACNKQTGRKAWLAISILTNIGMLSFFKYSDFLAVNVQSALALGGIQWTPPNLDFLLPVGISFYTFQSMSYTLDIYNKKLKPYDALSFALYVSFFTQLVAGPIVRAKDFLPQLQKKRIPTFNTASMGLFLIILGYFKKIVIADNLAPFAGKVFAHPEVYSNHDVMRGVISFATQIYCDFSGYSDIAIGISLLLGLRLKRNFNFPYLAMGFRDFWRRWHISLSTWIRDYIYIPLGGSRVSTPRHMMNILITMTLCGLWHGASWMFVLWGIFHGVMQISEYWIVKGWNTLEKGACPALQYIKEHFAFQLAITILTFTLVCIGWVLFRAETLDTCWIILEKISHFEFEFNRPEWVYIGIIALAHVGAFINKTFRICSKLHWSFYTTSMAIMSFFIITSWESNNVFIYFQF